MLRYEAAKKLYEEIKEKAAKNSAEGFDEVYRIFFQKAVDYAGTRAAWSFMSREERTEDDGNRAALHNGYMSMLGSVCRNLGIEGIDEILPDRKTKGDFACYAALFLSLEQR